MKTRGLFCALSLLMFFLVLSQAQTQVGADTSDTLALKHELVQINDSLSKIAVLLQYLVSGQKGGVFVERVAIEERILASLEAQILSLKKERDFLMALIYERRQRLDTLAGQEAQLVQEEMERYEIEVGEKERHLQELASTLHEHEANKSRIVKRLDEYLDLVAD